MPRQKDMWVTVLLTTEELKNMKLVVRACLEVGGDGDKLLPLAIRLQEGEERYKARQRKEREKEG